MPLPEPVLLERDYDEILAEALARIPVHTPEWTTFTESDPGVTIVQLFAFMTESLLYRANRIPERSRARFLQLLGVGLQPATPAAGVVTFDASREAAPHTLAGGAELFAGQVPFRTRNGLDVLPVEGRLYLKAPLDEPERSEVIALYEQLYASVLEEGEAAEPYQTRLVEPPAPGAALPVVDLATDPVDGALWLALLAPKAADPETTRRAIAGRTLTLAVVPAVSETARVLPPGNQADDAATAELRFERPDLRDITAPGGDALPPARYARLSSRAFDDVLTEPGVVELQLPGEDALGTWTSQEPQEAGVGDYPPSLEDDDAAARVVTWIRIRLADPSNGTTATARLSVVGVNGAVVEQRAEVAAEFVGVGTGEPDQAFALVNTPVLADSVTLTVNGEAWSPIDDLTAAGAEVQRQGAAFVTPPTPVGGERVRVYTLDRESGALRFGDGLHGARPPRGAVIQASYASGGGTRGLVGIGAITKGAALPGSVKVTNPVPTWGAADAEAVAAAEKRIPATLAHRDRLVTAEDFEEITHRTPGVDVGRVEVLPVTRPAGASGAVEPGAAGAVTVLVVPATDAAQPEAPRPDRLFLAAVCRYLDPRRLITTEVHVRGPVYVPVYVSAGIDAVAGRDLASTREAVKAALTDFLSPLVGGYGEDGWPLGNAVDTATLQAVAARVEGVARVNGLLLGTDVGASSGPIAIAGLQLPRLAGLAVQAGAPLPLDDLLGVASEGPARVPVPVVPATC